MIINVNKKMCLVPVSKSDFSFLKEIYQDEQIQTLALSVENFQIKDDNINRTIDYFMKSKDEMYIISSDGKPIGFVTLYDISHEKKEVKFGIAMLKEYQNFGTGLKVFNSVRKYVFDYLKLNYLISEVIEYNTTVSSMLQRVGFILTDIKLNEVIKSSERYNLELYTLKSTRV